MSQSNRTEAKAPAGQPCTWVDCNEKQANVTLLDRDGNPWCHLCEEHYKLQENAIDKALYEGGDENIKRMLGAWVKAHGGAKKMARGA